MTNWKQLAIDLILIDCTIDEGETRLLERAIMEDGDVDEEEVFFLSGLRKSARTTCDQFEKLFFEALELYILQDGYIDGAETEFIRSVVFADGIIDQNEKDFLANLAKKAKQTDHRFSLLCQECGLEI